MAEDLVSEISNPKPSWLRQVASERPIFAFILGAFVSSWLVYLPAAFLAPEWLTANPLGIALGAYGPSLSAFLVVYLVGGWQGLRAFLCQCLNWRVPVAWYMAALVAMLPIVIASRIIHGYLYQKTSLPMYFSGDVLAWVVLVLTSVLIGPLGEEFGWRGFLLPRLQARFPAWLSGILVGMVWALWQAPVLWTASRVLGWLPIFWFVIGGVAMSMLLTWMYNKSGGSVFMTILFSSAISVTNSVMGAGLLSLYPITAVIMWVAVLQIAVVNGLDDKKANGAVE